ncbi:FUBP3, partial [Cordylochernes scorpioides]
MGGSSSGNLSNVVVDEWKVPDHMVGLIIGRGGEQINRIQAESGCKVQMAAASEGSSERTCTLTGTQQAIEKCKELLAQIINGESRGPRGGGMGGSRFGGRNGGGPNNSSEHTLEMMIPAGKAGLVIGKGGETIRNLQNQAGVKMVIVQGGNDGNNIDKPLKITGEPQQCEYAKQLVMDLLAEKDMDRGQGGGRGRGTFEGNRPGFGRGRGRDDVQEHRLNVPANQCGRIIGKGGDYIRYISQTSGAHIELSRGPQPSPTEKTFIIRGNPQQIDHAQHLIHEKINDS